MLVWDIEANDFLPRVTTIHCIAMRDTDTGRAYFYGPNEIDAGIRQMEDYEYLVGHNTLGYDHPALKKVVGWTPSPQQKIRDTLVWARLCHSDLEREDQRSHREEVRALAGSNELEAWGVRLECPKNDYRGGFAAYTPEMGIYCQQDVKVNERLLVHLLAQPTSEAALLLEQRFAYESELMSQRGFPFNVGAAESLCEEIKGRMTSVTAQVREAIPGRVEEMKTPQYWLMKWPDGAEEQFVTKGEAETERKRRKIKPKECLLARGPNKVRVHEFNPGSRPQIRAYLLKEYDWISPKLTEKGQELLKTGGQYEELAHDYGKISEDILRVQEWPIAGQLADYLMLSKRVSQIRDGQQGWLRLVRDDGKIHHRMIPLGTPTSRCRHSAPNLGQVPHVLEGKNDEGEKYVKWGFEGRYGADCRALFLASEGYVLVGTDLSGIEARMLAHHLHPFDNGAFADQVLSGDIHQMNADNFQRLVGYTIMRNDTKTPFYAFCYACGREKQGVGICEVCSDARQTYKDVLHYLGSHRSARHDDRLASIIAFGVDRPLKTSDKYYHYARRKVAEARNYQDFSSLGYMVVGGKAFRAFTEGITGMDKLIEKIGRDAQKGWLEGLDGRQMPVRKAHAALNTRLQGDAAVVMKVWVVGVRADCRRRRLDTHMLACVHDEMQAEVREGQEEMYADLSVRHIHAAGKHFNLNIPLDGEAKIGKNWAETH